jgi:hypothetical protein
VLFGVWADAKMELARRVLTISSAAVALLITLAFQTEHADRASQTLMALCIGAFIFAVLATIWTLHRNPHLYQARRRQIAEDNSSESQEDKGDEDQEEDLDERVDSLEREVRFFNNTGKALFATGLALLLTLALQTVSNIPSP